MELDSSESSRKTKRELKSELDDLLSQQEDTLNHRVKSLILELWQQNQHFELVNGFNLVATLMIANLTLSLILCHFGLNKMYLNIVSAIKFNFH